MTDNSVLKRMKRFIENNYLLNRVPVGDDSDRFVEAILKEIPAADVLSVPSFEECLTWVIPPKWVVREAYVETLAGTRIADFSWHPMYLKSYSAPFAGEVSKAELLEHVLTDKKRPDCLIYDYRAQYQYQVREEWGFSIPYNVVREFKEPYYRVKVDTDFEAGEMKIVDLALPGLSSDTIFFAAHTCHPAQVNDGIACIAVIMELFRWLQQKKTLRYTYRMIFGPEYFAAAGLLAHDRDIDKLKYGFYLDMVCNGQELGFAHSYKANSYADRIIQHVMACSGYQYFEREYRGLWGNDEMFYDGPGFQIPTICIGRDKFDYYHTNKDDLANCDFTQLEETLVLLKNLVEAFETDRIPVRHYKGPLYLNKYDLYIDPKIDRKGQRSLQDIQILMDGERSCLDIANQLNISFGFVRAFCEALVKHDLASYKEKGILSK